MRRDLGATARLLAVFIVLALRPSAARADCQPPTRQSTCFDADELWTPAAPSRFIGIASGRTLAPRTYALGIDTTYLSRPVVLETGSPDPNGRAVRVVDDVVDVAAAFAYAPVRHLELTAILPAAIYRSGTGLVGVTSQNGPTLPVVALRDLRLGAAHDLLPSARGEEQPTEIGLATRLDVALPTGNDGVFAGERGPLVAPSVSFDLAHGIFFVGAQAGARLRRPVEIGGARLGTQLTSSFGAGANVLPSGRLALAVEAWLLPTFLSQRRTLPDGTLVTSGNLFPAEWMFSARTRLDDTVLALGLGSAIPWSSETRRATTGEESTTNFAGVTAPRFRAVLVVRYVPGSRQSSH
ncbi:MAG TPA: hypothetical protein VF395_09930 [Polyangiaceae bacterium]